MELSALTPQTNFSPSYYLLGYETAADSLPSVFPGSAVIGNGLYRVEDYGVNTSNSDTTNATNFNSLVSTVYAAGGGVIQFGVGVYQFPAWATFPNTGASSYTQPAIIIRGRGCYATAQPSGATASGGTIVKFTANQSPGRIDTRGTGYLGLQDITFWSVASGGTPILATTETCLNVQRCAFIGHAQGYETAIVLGGTATTSYTGASTDGFQGYGTVIRDCYFDYLNRCVLLQQWANNVVCEYNTTWGYCSGNAAYEMAPTSGAGGNDRGCVFAFNLIEAGAYTYAFKIGNYCSNNYFLFNSFWDTSSGSNTAVYRFESGATNNLVLPGLTDGSIPLFSDASSGQTNTLFTQNAIRLTPTTYSNLPTASACEGAKFSITDGTTSTWGATVSGSGSYHVEVRSNGTNWTVCGA